MSEWLVLVWQQRLALCGRASLQRRCVCVRHLEWLQWVLFELDNLQHQRLPHLRCRRQCLCELQHCHRRSLQRQRRLFMRRRRSVWFRPSVSGRSLRVQRHLVPQRVLRREPMLHPRQRPLRYFWSDVYVVFNRSAMQHLQRRVHLRQHVVPLRLLQWNDLQRLVDQHLRASRYDLQFV